MAKITGKFTQIAFGDTIFRVPDLPLEVERELIGDDAAREIERAAKGLPRVQVQKIEGITSWEISKDQTDTS